MKNNETEKLIGCCGLYCGLCTKYQSKAPSRCIGCRVGEQHDWCSIYRCCVKKHVYDTCAECKDVYYCDIFLRRKVAEWIPATDNLHQIKEVGLEKWLEEQRQRQILLEGLLQNYNEGRSMSFYCKVCARMSIELINEAMNEADKKLSSEKADTPDMKSKAKILKSLIKDLAIKADVNLDKT